VIDDQNVCPCGTRSFAGRGYLFCTGVADWRAALKFCLTYNYQLAYITNPTQDHFLEQTVASYANSKWWIGLNDLEQTGVWRWQNGTPFDYQHWGAGEPNDISGSEHCGELNRFGVDGGWNDEPCEQAQPFVCETAP
jgi:hypothetical protein